MAVCKNHLLIPWQFLACKHCPRPTRWFHRKTMLVGTGGGGAKAQCLMLKLFWWGSQGTWEGTHLGIPLDE